MKRTTLWGTLAVFLGITGAIHAASSYPPPRPPQHQKHPDWIGIVGAVGNAINHIPQHVPQYQPPQQYYQPQYYQPPQPQYIPVQQPPAVPVQPAKPVEVKPPKNAVPKVVKPIALTSNSLSLTSGLKVASARYAKDTAFALNQASQQAVDDLKTGLEDSGAVLSDQDKKDIEDYLKMINVPPDKLKNLMDALNANDPQAIQMAAQDLNLDSLFMNKGMTDALVTGANLSIRLDDLKAAVASGAPPEQIAQLAGQLATDIQQMNLPAVNTLGLNELLNQVVLASEVSGGIGNGIGPAGSPAEYPMGPCTIVCDPNMAAGQTCLLSDETMCIGTGGQGSLQVMQGTAASALGLPVGAEPPVEDTSGTAAVLGANGITVINPEATGAAVNYSLGSESFVLEPGASRQHGSANQTITFDKGESFGETRYSLSQGTYRFSVGQTGWELRRATFTVTIDNSDNPGDFSYVFNNELVTIPAGSSKTHSSNSLPVVRFNQGDEGEDARKELDSGTYYIAIDPETNLFNIFSSKPEPSKFASLKKKSSRQATRKSGLHN